MRKHSVTHYLTRRGAKTLAQNQSPLERAENRIKAAFRHTQPNGFIHKQRVRNKLPNARYDYKP